MPAPVKIALTPGGNMNKKVISALVLMLLLIFKGQALAHWWMPTLPIYPTEPTNCDTVKAGIFLGGCIQSISSNVSGNEIDVNVVYNGICWATGIAQAYYVTIGKLTSGSYLLRFTQDGKLMTGEEGVPYQKTFTITSADCATVSSTITLPSFQPQFGTSFKSYLTDVFTISGISINGVSGTFWASFQWNSKKLSFDIIAAGQDPQTWY
jgi:hypothetical protein